MSELMTTRDALHGIAETILAGPQYRRSGTIRLKVTPGGFGTITEPVLRVEGTELVAGDRSIPMDATTYRELAAAAGIEAGAPEGLYRDGSGVRPDEVIGVDAAAAAQVAGAFARGQQALRSFAPDTEPVLWPEHFDLGIALDEINYGVSPGDSHLGEPYAYAGPWRPREGSFWNAPFGASRPLSQLPDAASIGDFFLQARERAAADPLREG